MAMARTIINGLVGGLVVVTHASFALTQDVTISPLNEQLPSIKITITDDLTRWSMHKEMGFESLVMTGLTKGHAQSLFDSSLVAKKYYSEIINAGKCPDYIVKSDIFGKLVSADGNNISFQVICENNDLSLKYEYHDYYHANSVIQHIQWQDLEKMAHQVLGYYDVGSTSTKLSE